MSAEEASHGARKRYADLRMARIEATVSLGRTAYLYRSVYVPVDSTVNDESLGVFDFTKLQERGFEGWEIVTTITRTVGLGLTSKSLRKQHGNDVGRRHGGNVLGAYVLLRYSITAANLEASRAYIHDFLTGSTAARRLRSGDLG